MESGRKKGKKHNSEQAEVSISQAKQTLEWLTLHAPLFLENPVSIENIQSINSTLHNTALLIS